MALQPKRIALFSSYFETEALPYYIKFYLNQLRPHATHIVFITTDAKPLRAEDANWLGEHVEQIVLVKNEGFDFGMWQKVLYQTEGIESFDELILLNDSCVCFSDLDYYFNWHHKTPADVTGMTISNDVSLHIQSFFMVIKKPALSTVVNHIKSLPLRNTVFSEVIAMGELGLSSEIMRKEFSIDALFVAQRDDLKNPMYAHCLNLIKQHHIPLVKRKLFQNYHMDAMLHIYGLTGSYHHRALLKFIQTHHHLSDDMMTLLFSADPIKLNTTKRLKLYLKVLVKKLGNLKDWRTRDGLS
ncbi:MAG: hypothetical protein H6R05_1685 [Burkholderiaceae bacterium]|nr:hypothetical protein [Burkholderiaceae bacterium]